MIGQMLGPYQILSKVGEGGMGEVYRARDTRLDRSVAIKVLPAELSADPERRARFEREAKTIAGLTHPHICTLYDVGEHEGSTFLVMEHLTGETLAQRLERGPLPIEQALTVGTEIADALAAAHREHVVHRDLKPGNVMLTKTGAKLLDFGLAKLRTPEATGGTGASSLPTQQPATAEGTLLGTVPYMAPEQLEGKATDARSDLFSFGAVLYEMVTRRRAFQGESHASVIAAIMSSEPPAISSLQSVTPPALDRLVQRCLAKDPQVRWQSAVDVADELRWISTGSGMAAPARGRARGGHRWAWIAAALGIGACAGGVWWWTVRAPGVADTPRQVTLTQLTFDGNAFLAALSPNGGTVAYVTGEMMKDVRVKVRDVTGGQAAEVWRGPFCTDVQWMPDGKQILIAGTDAGHQLVSRFGGTPRRIPVPAATGSAAISPDGTRIAAATWTNPGFEVTALDGGSTREAAVADAQGVFGLRWSRSGKRLALAGTTQQQASVVWTVNPDGSGLRLAYACALGMPSFAWSPSDADAVTDSEAFLEWLPDGRLAWRAGEPQRWLQDYWILDLANGRRELLIKTPPQSAWVQQVFFSPTGRQVALHWTREQEGLWVLTGPDRTERFLAAGLWPAGWTADGRWIHAYRYADREIVRVNAESGAATSVGRFSEGVLGMGACGQTPDRGALICSLDDTKTDLWIVDHFDPHAPSPKR